MNKLFTGLIMGFIVILIVAFILAIVTQLAWACSIAQIFHVPELSFFQAFWLNVLGGMLFKNSTGSSK